MSIRTLINKSLDEIRQSLFERIGEKQDEYASKGWLPVRLNLNKGVVRGMVELWAWGLYQLYQFLSLVLNQAFANAATGLWLDLHCKQVEVYRKKTTKANGSIYFTRLVGEGNLPIAAGRIIKTLPDGQGNVYRFVTTERVVLADGQFEVAVTVEAEEYGAGSNVTTNQISEIVTSIDGIDAVENRADWLISEGANKEEDPALQQRYTLAWQKLNGVTKHAYRAWALSVTGVVAAAILDQHPRGQGTIDVVIKGTAGAPTQALIDAVDAVINGTGAEDEQAPINDDVLIKGPSLVNHSLDAELVLTHGDPAAVIAIADARYRALFTPDVDVTGVPNLQIGQDLPLDLQSAVLMGVDGVKQINFTGGADVAVPADGLAILQAINLTSSQASED